MSAAAQKVYVVSLGCPKNQVDTEVMLGELVGAGHALVDEPEGADVIVVNTCAFIDAAKEESIDTILELAEHKKGACRQLVVTGCLAQRHAGELAAEIPEIDHLVGSADFPGIAGLVGGAGAAAGPGRRALPMADKVKVSQTPAWIYDHRTPRLRVGARHLAYVKIAEGCDRPCAFCIIPALRGPQRSRTIDDVAAEVRRLVAEGAREINLIAQDLTRYGWDLGDDPAARPTLARLLRELASTGAPWLRLHYTFPSAFDDELIDVIAGEPAVVKYVDVPLQHIDDGLLKAMRRGHSSRVIRGLVDTLRARIDGVVLRTTFIVGHPGETEEAFARLCEFVEEARLDHVGVFTYSHEPGTVSAMLPHLVPAEVAEARRDRLMAIQQRISRARLEAMVGRQLEVLVDGVAEESDLLLQGRWYGQAPGVDGVVYLADGTARPGELVRARVTQAADYDLAASLEQAS
jgi:ribosomal protein S12 methylthiotransferase